METLLGSCQSDSPTVPEFDRVKHHIAAALVYCKGSHSLEDVKRAIAGGNAQLWTGEDSVIVTEVVDTPQRRELRYWLAGGDMEQLEAMYDVISKWGREEMQCDYEIMVGRKGWDRSWLTKRAGWSAEAMVFYKELS